jgi:hypothetical protein
MYRFCRRKFMGSFEKEIARSGEHFNGVFCETGAHFLI